ncbi:MAG TPA: hypothetical protein PLW93_02575 [Candidatus Absconditabacterales bacterium]|nr:hypothetical protein [Candidatus Absconditabacterales bacterium]
MSGGGIITKVKQFSKKNTLTQSDITHYIRDILSIHFTFQNNLSPGDPLWIAQRKKLLPPSCDSRGLSMILGGKPNISLSHSMSNYGFVRYYDLIIGAFPEYHLKPIEYVKLYNRIQGGFYQQALGSGNPDAEYQKMYQSGIQNNYTGPAFLKLFDDILNKTVKSYQLHIYGSNTKGFQQKLLEMIYGLGDMVVYYDFGILTKGALAYTISIKRFERLTAYKLNLKTILASGFDKSSNGGDNRTGEEQMDRRVYHAGSIHDPRNEPDEDILTWLDIIGEMDEVHPIRVGFENVFERIDTLKQKNKSKFKALTKETMIRELEQACGLTLTQIKKQVEEFKAQLGTDEDQEENSFTLDR